MSISSRQATFATTPAPDVPRSALDRHRRLITTFDANYLVPVFVDEALPGDSMSVKMTAFFRFATLLKPLFSNITVDVHFFAVPLRLLWSGFTTMMGERTNPDTDIEVEIPQMTSPALGYQVHSLHDYLGLPTNVPGITHSSMWHRAYYLIYDQWYRDQNLQDSIVDPLGVSFYGAGPDDPADFVLQKRNKRHDYFTSCLPWPQKGGAIQAPIGVSAPVVQVPGTAPQFIVSGDTAKSLRFTSGSTDATWSSSATVSGSAEFNGTTTGLEVDLVNGELATINQLREAAAVQRLLEKDARGGTRFPEMLKAHFGVEMPEAQWRSSYLGGGSIPLGTHEVPQTSSTDATTPQANLSAYGTGNGGASFQASFVEHCVILGIASARAEDTHVYQQGVDRMFRRKTRYDFFWPELANLGEEVVHNAEIYAQGTAADEQPFGYQERWSSYRYGVSKVTGKFRSNYAQSLDLWHLAPEFGTLPTLGDTFIQENVPVPRVVAVPSEPHFLFDSETSVRHVRPIPVRSIPGYTARF